MWFEIIKFFREIILGELDRIEVQKSKIADFLKEISNLLEITAEQLKSDNYPHGSCAAMSALSNKLVDALDGKIEETEKIRLARLLDEACILEREWVERNNPATIDRLHQIAGELKAISLLLNI